MRALSANTIALLGELYRRAARSHDGAVLDLLARIASTGEPLAIPRIIALVVDKRRAVAEAAARAVQQLRSPISVRDLAVLDHACRGRAPYLHDDAARWHKLQPSDLSPIATLPGGPTIVQLATCHPSGYVRHEAIRRSAMCTDGSEIPFLVLRSNDWVKPVRDLAQSALRARLTEDRLHDLAAALPMLDAMCAWGRLGAPDLVDDIEALLGSPKALVALLAALASSSDRFVRRSALRRLLDPARLRSDAHAAAAGADPYRARPPVAPLTHDCIAIAMRDTDPAIRAWIGRWLLAAGNDQFLAFSDALLCHRQGALRLQTAHRLLALNRRLPWRVLLLDDHAGVRSLAQTAALNADQDPAEHYRHLIASSQSARLGISLVGLSETGNADDAAVLRGHLAARLPIVRRSALHALCNLEVDDATDLCLAALADTSPSVTHTARRLLLARIASLRPATLWVTFQQVATSWGQRDAIAVLSGTGYWDGLPYLVRAFSASSSAVRKGASRYLARRIARQHRMFTTPSRRVADELRAALAEPALSDDFRRELNRILDARLPAAT